MPKTLAYSVQKGDSVPVRYCVTIHIQNGDTSESVQHHFVKFIDSAHTLAVRIGECNRIPIDRVCCCDGPGLPQFGSTDAVIETTIGRFGVSIPKSVEDRMAALDAGDYHV